MQGAGFLGMLTSESRKLPRDFDRPIAHAIAARGCKNAWLDLRPCQDTDFVDKAPVGATLQPEVSRGGGGGPAQWQHM